MIPLPQPCYVFMSGGALRPVIVGRRERRRWDSPSEQRKWPQNVDWRLTQAARARVVENLTSYGNVVDEAQHAALLCVVGCFTMLAAGVKTGRYAYNLPPGYGKTEAVVAWCAEAYRYEKRRTALICSSKVIDLCNIKRKLMEQGVPEAQIGLVHSKSLSEVPFAATDDNEARQFLLVTHERVKRGDDIAKRYRLADGRKRDLVVWDESLLIGTPRAEDYRGVESTIAGLRPMLGYPGISDETRLTVQYLDHAWSILEVEWLDQKATGREPIAVNLDPLPADLGVMLKALPRKIGSAKIDTGPAEFILRVSQEPLRVFFGERGGFIQYDIVIPPEFESIAVLDASFGIRALEELGQNAPKTDPDYAAVMKRHRGKRYDAVTLFRLKHAAGRTSIEAEFRKKPDNRTLVSEYVETVKSFPVTEGVLTFTHKHRSKFEPNITAELQKALGDAGIDISTVIQTKDGPKPRFGWLTFGQETSSNDYTHLRHGVSFGVYYLDRSVLAAQAAGQADDLLLPLGKATMADLERGEILHSQYQAMNRLIMRETENGQARPSTWHFIYRDDSLDAKLAEVMPGVTLKEWTPVYLAKRTTKSGATAEATVAYLDGLPLSDTRVPLRTLKAAIPFKVDRDTFRLGRELALIERPQWRVEGQSLVRD